MFYECNIKPHDIKSEQMSLRMNVVEFENIPQFGSCALLLLSK